MSKYEGAIRARDEQILNGKRRDCSKTLKGWGFNLADERTHLLMDAAMLMHLEATEAPEAIREAEELCGSLVENCYNSSEKMREEIFPCGDSVEDVINYLVTALDDFMVTTMNDV